MILIHHFRLLFQKMIFHRFRNILSRPFYPFYKTLIIIAIFSILTIDGKVQSGNCSFYKTGKFILFESKLGLHSQIERTASRQIETEVSTGKTIVFSVTWLSDCEYELSVIEGTSESVNFFRGKKLIIKILEVYADGDKFESHIKGSNLYKSYILRSM